MFVGHYGVAFAVKTERNKIPLWVLFVAVQLLDFLWAPFVLLEIEKVRFVLGITATNALELYYMPYTHSLIGALFWSAVALAIYKIGCRNIASNSAALLVGFAVFSHWLQIRPSPFSIPDRLGKRPNSSPLLDGLGAPECR